MALSHSPQIVTNGLVFAYDMANTKKSWKGKPTTNLFTDPLNLTSGWVGNQGGGLGAKDSNNTILAPDGVSVAYRFYAASGGSTWTQNVTGLTIGATYSISCYVYPMGWTPYFYSPANVTYGAVTYSDVSGYPGWKRMSTTLTTTVSNPYIGVHVGWSPGTSYAYYWGIQLELGSEVSSLVNGTRSNTQSILDLTGTNTITANSLTYASDGTFSFNGTTNYITINTPVMPTDNYTIELVLKASSFATSPIVLCPQNAGIDQFIQFNTSGTFTFKLAAGGDTGERAYTSSDICQVDAYCHIVCVKNGPNIAMYKNGILTASSTADTLASAGWGNTACIIGQRGNSTYYFQGVIPSVKVYSRGLTAEEVTQNYNAIKSRYYGEMPEFPALSGYDLKAKRPELPSGWYWIKSAAMPNALRMYVDMVQEGGGYDFYVITGGIAADRVNVPGSGGGANSGTPLGLDIVYPRSKEHWQAMYNFIELVLAQNINTYFASNMGAVYRETSYNAGSRSGNYTADIMRNPAYYGTGAPDWRVPDAGRWWLSDVTYSEPNGDYAAYGFLGNRGIPRPYTGQSLTFNDLGNYTQTTGNTYLVSTNAKP